MHFEELSKFTGIHHSTLCLWLQGKIKGHHVKIEETLEAWLQNLDSSQPRFAKNNPTTKFFGTKSVEFKEPVLETRAVEVPTRNFNQEDELIPVRIDIESEGIRYRENISWNLNEPFLTPEAFSKNVAEENNLPISFEHEMTM